ncbi:MAG: helix-turn-helix transcriptional regulator [Cyclobacteriaceae bacterium]|nr:helix-turn-helix transcriptional regulator [Cyclobacteriaceae bacterium]
MKPLTAQEKRVLELVSQGLSSIEIAQALGVSAHTVDSHRKNLLVKMSARNSADLVRRAYHFQVLSLESIETENLLSHGAI